MGVIRHAALRAHEQHTIWQQVIIKIENTLQSAFKSKEDRQDNLDASHSKK